ncbi:MAG TPA: glycosyltransferase family 4 protein [Verrucomicrobiae bacterium]
MTNGVSKISLLTAGRDRPYALGMASALVGTGTHFDFIGSDEVNGPELHVSPQVRFLNLRGDQSVQAGLPRKTVRILSYYARLVGYAFTARPRIFHILWNNKFELIDRTLLMLLYKLLGKKIVFTAHNVNIRARDGGDSWLNRATLKFQYRFCDHIFLHTERMKAELVSEFGIPEKKVTVIPFGLNSTTPDTDLTPAAARRRLGLRTDERVLLFFGNIAPYKGLEYLVDAFIGLVAAAHNFRLVIAGRPKGNEAYWAKILATINGSSLRDRFLLRIEFVPDAETEVYFKAADVLVLPYTHVFQSGVLFLGYNFGLPAIVADVGALKEEVVEGETGYICRPCDSADLRRAIETYFAGELFANLPARRQSIREFARDRYSWTKVARMVTAVYTQLNGHHA